MFEFTAFAAATALIAWISRASLRAPASPGFYRFFAWEALLALILLNWRTWFATPFAPLQTVSWLLLIASADFVIAGVGLVRRQRQGKKT